MKVAARRGSQTWSTPAQPPTYRGAAHVQRPASAGRNPGPAGRHRSRRARCWWPRRSRAPRRRAALRRRPFAEVPRRDGRRPAGAGGDAGDVQPGAQRYPGAGGGGPQQGVELALVEQVRRRMAVRGRPGCPPERGERAPPRVEQPQPGGRAADRREGRRPPRPAAGRARPRRRGAPPAAAATARDRRSSTVAGDAVAGQQQRGGQAGGPGADHDHRIRGPTAVSRTRLRRAAGRPARRAAGPASAPTGRARCPGRGTRRRTGPTATTASPRPRRDRAADPRRGCTRRPGRARSPRSRAARRGS